MIHYVGFSSDDEEELGGEQYPLDKEDVSEKVTHTLEVHGDTCILIPANLQVIGIPKMLEIIHSLPDTVKKLENDFMYRASIQMNDTPVVVYYFRVSHLPHSDREKFIIESMTELLENGGLPDNALIVGTPDKDTLAIQEGEEEEDEIELQMVELEAGEAIVLLSYSEIDVRDEAKKIIDSVKGNIDFIQTLPLSKYSQPPKYTLRTLADGQKNVDIYLFSKEAGNTYNSMKTEIRATQIAHTILGGNEQRIVVALLV